MSGTSIDALDAALVIVRGEGLGMYATVERCASRPLGPLADSLRRLAVQEPMPAGSVARVAHDLALLHVAVVRELTDEQPIDLIAVHGQTIFHAPPLSWQLLSPAPIAHVLRTPVVFDLRAADLAAGGQGAPITPLADYVLFRDQNESRAVVNLGGYCNFTLLPRSLAASTADRDAELNEIRGGDICACNQVLDLIARTLFGRPFDRDGQCARAGQMRPVARDELVERLCAQARAGRSLGTGDELTEWVERHRARFSGEDLARSACDALAAVITDTIDTEAGDGPASSVDRCLLAGGGVHNTVLVESLASRCRVPVDLTDTFGVPSRHREAAALAVLGALCQDRVPITLPNVTGVKRSAPVAGAWVYPGCSQPGGQNT